MYGRIVEILGSARSRKAMYLGTVDVPSAEIFLNGFQIGCFACGQDVPLEIRKQATTTRGWKWCAKKPIDEMKERGLTDDEIVDELFAIEIDAWQLWKG